MSTATLIGRSRPTAFTPAKFAILPVESGCPQTPSAETLPCE